MADLSKEYDRVSNSEEMTQLIRTFSKGVGEDLFDEDLQKLETRLDVINGWVADTKLELEKLPANPESFDDILATIEPERTKKVKKFRFELEQLQEKRNNVTEEHEEDAQVKKFSDRLFDIVAKERKVKAAIKSLEEASNNRIARAAFMFKKRIKQFIDEYWDEAKVCRVVLEKATKGCRRRLPKNLDSDNAKKLMAATVKDRATAEGEKAKVVKLSRLGSFIGKMRAEGAKDIKIDSADMKKLYESAINKLNKRIQELKKKAVELKKEEEQQKLKKCDDEHKKEFQILFEWADTKLHEVTNLGQEAKLLVRSPRKGKMKEKKLDAMVETMKDLLEVDVPKKEIAVNEGMTNLSAYLEDHNYGHIKNVKDREKQVKVSLRKLSKQVQEELEKLIARREGKQVSPRKGSPKKREVKKVEEKKAEKLDNSNEGALDEWKAETPRTKQRSLKEAAQNLEQWTTTQAEKSLSPKKPRELKKISSPKENSTLSNDKSLSALSQKKTLSEELVKNLSSPMTEKKKANKERRSIVTAPASNFADQLTIGAADSNLRGTQSSLSLASEGPFELAAFPTISFPGFFDVPASRSVSHQTLKKEQSIGQLIEDVEKLQGEKGDLQRQVARLEKENKDLVEEKEYLEMENSSLTKNQNNPDAVQMLAISNKL